MSIDDIEATIDEWIVSQPRPTHGELAPIREHAARGSTGVVYEGDDGAGHVIVWSDGATEMVILHPSQAEPLAFDNGRVAQASELRTLLDRFAGQLARLRLEREP